MGIFDDKYCQNDEEAGGETIVAHRELSLCAPAEAGLLLSELTEKYLAEKQARGKGAENTHKANRRYFNLFIEHLGDSPVKSITRDQIVECLVKMKRIPSRREVIPEYRDKSIKDLLELDSVKNPLGTQTVKNHISTLSSCFKLAVLHGHMGNPWSLIAALTRPRRRCHNPDIGNAERKYCSQRAMVLRGMENSRISSLLPTPFGRL